MVKLSTELCHWYVTVAPDEIDGVVILVIGLGISPEHIVWVPDMEPALIIFSRTVNVWTAVQPWGVVMSSFTVIEELKVGEGVAYKVTDVCAAAAGIVSIMASLMENW